MVRTLLAAVLMAPLVAGGLGGLPARAAALDDPYLELNSYSGDGCPDGTVHEVPGNGPLVMKLYYGKFHPHATGNTRTLLSCNVTLKIKNITGYRWTTTKVRQYGTYSVAPGGNVSLVSSVLYSNDPKHVAEGEFVVKHPGAGTPGPVAERFEDPLKLVGEVWLPCDSDPSINISMLAEATNTRAGTTTKIGLQQSNVATEFEARIERC